MYRFRTIESLLGKHQELENQEIYFALPEELNDPMEGYRDLFWKGDTIIWKNLLINYIRSVEHIFTLTILLNDKKKINEEDILVSPNPNGRGTSKNEALIQQIIETTFRFEFISNLPKALSERKNVIRHFELLSYLEFIHPFVLNSISEVYLKNKLIAKPFLQQNLEKFTRLIEKSGNLVDLIDKLESESNDVENFGERFLLLTNFQSQQVRLLTKYNLSDKERASNKYFLVSEFTERYLSKLESLIYPDWYSASFLYNCSNSSIWGYYGDNHKGVCLKFKVNEHDEKCDINLETEYGYSSGPTIGMRPHTFKKIKYNNKHVEIDFFRSMGRLPIILLNALWYSDENGNLSVCGEHLNKNKDEWRESYWENFDNSLIVKLDEWSYEEEYRLILDGSFVDYRNKDKRKLKYDFKDLESIVFGIKTDTNDKMRILKIIENKCKKYNRKEFDFYQAYYSKDSGKIEKHKLSLLKFD